MFFTHKLTIGSTFKVPFHTIEKVNDIGDTVPVNTAWISAKLLNVEFNNECEVTHHIASTFTLEVDGKEIEVDRQTLFDTLFEHAYFGAETALQLDWQGIRESENEDEWLLFDYDEPVASILLNNQQQRGTKYLVIQKGSSIFGQGQTACSAVADMKQWIDSDSEMQDWTVNDFNTSYDSANDGEFVLVGNQIGLSLQNNNELIEQLLEQYQ